MTDKLIRIVTLCEHGLTERHQICNDLPGEDQHGEWCYCSGLTVDLTREEAIECLIYCTGFQSLGQHGVLLAMEAVDALLAGGSE